MASEIPVRHRALADPSRVRVLDALVGARAPVDAAELARRVGLHANTVRFHLGVLAEAGLAESTVEARSEPGRPRVLYAATAEGAGGDREDYRFLARMLASALDDVPGRDAVAERAGHGWGRYLVERRAPDERIDAKAATAEIVRLLDQQGFAPESHGAVICSLHLGMLRGALEELRAPVRVHALRPFAEPGVCLIELDYE